MAKRSRKIAFHKNQFRPRRVVSLELAGAFQRLGGGGMLRGGHRAEDGLQLAKRDHPRTQEGRRVAGEVEHGGLDAEVARAAVEHQRDAAAELIDNMLRPCR